MSDIIDEIIAKKGFLLADGATGTNLFNLRLEAGDPPEFWNVDEPDKIRSLYQGSVDSGCDLFLTNSFGGNASRLKLHNSEDRAYELSLAASKLGREVADKSGREILVAGSIGPTGDIMGDAGWLSHNEAVQMFQVTAQGLMDGGADLIWVETISSPEEFIAASEAIENINAPWVGTMSFDTAGRTMMGVTSHDMSNLVKKMKYAPIGFGANCGVGASDLLRTVLGLNENADRPIIAKGNAGIPKYVDGHIHYDGTPEVMAEYAVLARACGATIIGGCCGTMPAHLKAMRRALDNYEVRDVPSLSEISKALGPFSSETDGTGDGPKPARVRRGQRR